MVTGHVVVLNDILAEEIGVFLHAEHVEVVAVVEIRFGVKAYLLEGVVIVAEYIAVFVYHCLHLVIDLHVTLAVGAMRPAHKEHIFKPYRLAVFEQFTQALLRIIAHRRVVFLKLRRLAAHCGGGNTGCIGLSVCGMAGFNLNKKETKYPLTQKQVETLCCLTAYLTIKYGIIIKENSVFTHYEFDSKKAKPEGKIDITYLP